MINKKNKFDFFYIFIRSKYSRPNNIYMRIFHLLFSKRKLTVRLVSFSIKS